MPQEPFLDNQLDLLYQRGKQNGAHVHIWDEKELKRLPMKIKYWKSIMESKYSGSKI